jgi:NTP pyrophosphatase (non-canonical NTP hydrolase)
MNPLEQFQNINMNLLLLAEECQEVSQCVTKALRFGLTDCDPDLENSLPKYQLLEQELGDLLAIIDILKFNNIGISTSGIEAAKQKKFKRLAGYYGSIVENKAL